MAACSDTEEKPSSPKETLPLKICVENAVNHEMRKNCYNEFSNVSKSHDTFSKTVEKPDSDVNTLSEAEFLELMIEVSTFNKSTKEESALLQKLRSDNPVTDTEPSDKAKLIKNNSQFSVHRNSKHCVGTNSSLSSNTSHLRTDGRKKHFRNKDDSHSRNILNANALQKGIHQSQSLQDLSSKTASDCSKSKQKSHKAHRTHSLSSDEVTGTDSDSLLTSKNGKKSYKQSSSSNSSKTEVNKSNLNKICSKASRLSGPTSAKAEVENTQSNKPQAGQSSMSDSDIATVNCKSEPLVENSLSISPPIEIEMEEIKSDKSPPSDDGSGKELERSQNGLAEGNSKFYVDCNDIDSTVTFPLKLVSSIDDQNNEAMSEQLKRFPLVPWPRPLQVQSFFSSLPMDTDSFGSRNDKQLLNTDINGNPFTRNTRPSNLASFVSSTLMDYSNGSLVSETKNRKNKRSRNAVNKGVLSENIAGHRGEEDIDTLLQYINSSDKKGKVAVKGNSQNQILSNKSSLLHENERKKSFGKEVKNCNKNVINTVKKKLTRCSSLENIASSTDDVESVFSFEPRVSISLSKDPTHAPIDNSTVETLDINSNEESKSQESQEKGRESGTDDYSLHDSIEHSSPEVSSFAADFYSTADVSSQTIEETGFLMVKKKQRKKHQGKRSDSYRWRNAQAQRKKGMMLPLAESKCGKQDSRRKSTSSVPHSEHSSADNSDLDSVHSLPVRGSVPHPTQTHPHTTPSSSSSTPQASYADIARMPISKLNSASPSIITYSAQSTIKQQTGEQEIKRTENATTSNLPPMKRRVSDTREPPSLSKENVPTPPVDVESDNSSASDVKVRFHAKSTREINTQTEPETLVVADVSKIDNSDTIPFKNIDDLPKNVCSFCSTRKGNCTCSKTHASARQKVNMGMPPVVMDNMLPESNACDVSFGFGIEEVLEMKPTGSALSVDARQKDCPEVSNSETEYKTIEIQKKRDGISEISSVNTKTASVTKSSPSLDAPSKTVQRQDLSHEQSSHLKKVVYGTGKVLLYKETKVHNSNFNQSEFNNFLGKDFLTIQRELEGNSKNKSSSKAKYYVDSSEDA